MACRNSASRNFAMTWYLGNILRIIGRHIRSWSFWSSLIRYSERSGRSTQLFVQSSNVETFESTQLCSVETTELRTVAMKLEEVVSGRFSNPLSSKTLVRPCHLWTHGIFYLWIRKRSISPDISGAVYVGVDTNFTCGVPSFVLAQQETPLYRFVSIRSIRKLAMIISTVRIHSWKAIQNCYIGISIWHQFTPCTVRRSAERQFEFQFTRTKLIWSNQINTNFVIRALRNPLSQWTEILSAK